MKDTVTIVLKKQRHGERKLERFLNRKLKHKSLSFKQIDQLDIACQIYNSHRTKARTLRPTYIFTVSFSNYFLKSMEVSVQSVHGERLSLEILKAVEDRLCRNIKEKNLQEQDIIQKDLAEVFRSFLNSGFLMTSPTWSEMLYTAQAGQEIWKSKKGDVPQALRRKINQMFAIDKKEEVLNFVR
ncbi:hypothetical protein ACFSJM_06865 [Lactococcus formosensis subsp. bovis]|uniref:hypothetical protein n=1 Tax=Lactococcus formosensis TaxID=1281486 RepID=UPI001BD0FDA8|nr:hypothetical protein [Lactococcus formosensis]